MKNIVWYNAEITKEKRAELTDQKPCILWFTGFSGSGKSSIANAVEEKLYDNKNFTYLLDGDNIRHGLNKDLGFSEEDRMENIRRIGEIAKLFVDAGLIVLAAFISPFKKDREFVRNLVKGGEFIEIFIDTPIEECEKRDSKGLYKKARSGELKNFTGIDSPYEFPENPEIHIKNASTSIDKASDIVIEYLIKNDYIRNRG